ncbi:hypothetical protein [Halarchaeum sp. P4]
MPAALRDGVRVALNRPRVLGVVALAVVLETGLRLAFALATRRSPCSAHQ